MAAAMEWAGYVPTCMAAWAYRNAARYTSVVWLASSWCGLLNERAQPILFSFFRTCTRLEDVLIIFAWPVLFVCRALSGRRMPVASKSDQTTTTTSSSRAMLDDGSCFSCEKLDITTHTTRGAMYQHYYWWCRLLARSSVFCFL